MNLRAVIKKLDIPRRQVFVEASILEISLDKSRDLGLAYHGGGVVGEGDSESIIFGGVQHPEWSSLLINPLALMGLAVGARGKPIEGSNTLLGLSDDIPSFGVMFQAMQNNSNVNVLSSPHLLTTDNEEAEITVGQNIPFQGAFMGGGFGNLAGQAGGQQGLGSILPAVSVQRQDVALKLKLTPHVNESDMVRLELEQEVSDIASPNFNNLGPSTSKRTAKTVVVVRDQQTVVIGGLMGDRVQNSVNKVPLLGDIPILGYLFKYTSKTVQKTNLIIVLTPYVIRDQSDLRRIFKKKLQERREFIERYTSFEHRDVPQDIDYRHKRGLLAEIAKVAEQAAQEALLLREAKRNLHEDVDPVEMPEGMTAPAGSEPPAEIPSDETPSSPPPQPKAPAPQIQ
jgi:general secretion pathway protein D